MRPAERLVRTQRIAQSLNEGPIDDINVTLRTFGFLTWSEWETSDYVYITERLAEGTDERLIELDEHLHPQAAAQAQAVESDRQWQPDAFRLFLSHTHPYRERAGGDRRRL